MKRAAMLRRPDGKDWVMPLFWDGRTAWTLRVSPDLAGEWFYSVRSTDPGPNGKSGSFRCVESTLHGSIQAMKGHLPHFQYQTGTPFWFFGEKAWRVFQTDRAEKLDHDHAMHHVDVRAEQGFNYMHTELAGTGGLTSGGNEGGEMFVDADKEVINPAFFQEVDGRLRHINEKGIMICGMVVLYAKGEWWLLEPRDELVNAEGGYAYCLADPGKTYVVYVVGSKGAELKLADGECCLSRYDPRTGRSTELPTSAGGPARLAAPNAQDWVFLVKANGVGAPQTHSTSGVFTDYLGAACSSSKVLERNSLL